MYKPCETVSDAQPDDDGKTHLDTEALEIIQGIDEPLEVAAMAHLV